MVILNAPLFHSDCNKNKTLRHCLLCVFLKELEDIGEIFVFVALFTEKLVEISGQTAHGSH